MPNLLPAGMADRGGFDRGFGGRGRGDRGRGRGRPRGGRKDEEEKWVPCTKLGRLVQQASAPEMGCSGILPREQ